MHPGRALRGFVRQHPKRRRLLLEAFLELLRARIRVVLDARGAVREVFDAEEPAPAAEEVPTVQEIASAVRAVGSVVPGGRACLPQSLAGHRLLDRYGYPVEVRIGATREGDADPLEAHAWVEHGGRPVIGDHPGLDRYRTLD